MKRIILLLAGMCAFSGAYSQGMAVNTTGAAADSSAIVDMNSTTQGMLVPRMDSTHRVTISKPATGLMVYQTNGLTPGYYYNSGTATLPLWTPVGGVPTGTTKGDMMYWNGHAWTRIAAGTNGQMLLMIGGVPTWGNID